jgi:hypothetical protein
VADRTEGRRVAGVADSHEDDEHQAERAGERRQRSHCARDDPRSADGLQVHEDERQQGKQRVGRASVQREQTGAGRTDAREREQREQPPLPVNAIEDCTAREVQQAGDDQRDVEQQCRLGDHSKVTDRRGTEGIARRHRRREHNGGQELRGQREKCQPRDSARVGAPVANSEYRSGVGLECTHLSFTAF